MNTGASWPSLAEAEARVLGLQSKLHRWATADSGRSFDDLFNLVCDPAFLRVAWERVRGNKGAGTAGVDGVSARSITDVEEFLSGLRADLKARRFIPTPVRERMIPKAGGKLRRLGIPTVTDRVVQASLKLVLEPVFEADFKPCSYGFRPRLVLLGLHGRAVQRCSSNESKSSRRHQAHSTTASSELNRPVFSGGLIA